MRRHTKIVLGRLLLIALSILFTSCGGSSPSSTGTGNVPLPSTTVGLSLPGTLFASHGLLQNSQLLRGISSKSNTLLTKKSLPTLSGVVYYLPVYNTGSSVLNIQSASVTNSRVWAIDSTGCESVPVNESCILSVGFNAGNVTSASELNSLISLTYSNGTSGFIPISGAIVESGSLNSQIQNTIVPNESGFAYGVISLFNGESNPQQVDVSMITLSPQTTASWIFSANCDGNGGNIIQPYHACSIAYIYHTTSENSARTFNVSVPVRNTITNTTTTLQLSTTTTPAQSAASPSAYVVYNGATVVLSPATGNAGSFTLQNAGNATLSGIGFSSLGGLNQSNNCTNIAANGVCTVNLSGTPASNSIIVTAGSQSITVPVIGQELAVSPATYSFGTNDGGAILNATVTISNLGSELLTNISESLNGNAAFTISNLSTCPANTGTIAGFNSCTVIVQYTAPNIFATESAIFTESANNQVPQTTSLTASSIAVAAIISLESVTLSPLASAGIGAESNQFEVESQTAGQTIILTYTNTGKVAAESFSVGTSSLSSAYTLNTNNCHNVVLEPKIGTCSVILNVATSVVQTESLSLESAGLPVSWNDQSGSYANQGINWTNPVTAGSQSTIYTNVYTKAKIIACTTSESGQCNTFESIVANTNFYLYYSLSGGYPGESFVYDPLYNTSPVGSCHLISGITSFCNIAVNSGNTPGNGNINFGLPSTGGVAPQPESDSVTVYPTPQITFTTAGLSAGESVVQGESFTITATLNNSFNISNQTISAASILPTGQAVGSTTCQLSSVQPSCSIAVTTTQYLTSPESYIIIMQDTSSALSLVNESIHFNVILPVHANIIVESVVLSPAQNSGNGASSTPFQIESQTSLQTNQILTLTYANTGNGAAENFVVNGLFPLPAGYIESTTASTCNTTAVLESYSQNSCTLVLSVPTSIVASQNLSLLSNSLPVSWTDESGTFESQMANWINSNVNPAASQSSVYLNIYSANTVDAYISSESSMPVVIESINNMTSFYLYYNFSGGYIGESFTYSPTLPAGMIFSSESSCTVTYASKTCSIAVNSNGATSGNNTIDFGNANGRLPATPESSAITVYPVPYIKFTTSGLSRGESVVQGESFTVTASLNGGFSISKQMINVASIMPGNESIGFVPESCGVSSNSSSCSISVTTAKYITSPESYILTMQNISSNIALESNVINFNVVLPHFAQIIIESVVLSPVESAGKGSQNQPFYIESQTTSQKMTLTYRNIGNGTAYNFKVESVTLSPGYTLGVNNCSSVPLESYSGICTVIFNLTTTAAGTESLSLESSSIVASWNDESGVFSNQAINWLNTNAGPAVSQDIIYASVFNKGSVFAYLSSESTSLQQIESIVAESVFYAYYTLTGGYPGQMLSYQAAYNGSQPPACTLIAGQFPSCSIMFNSGSTGAESVVNFNAANSGVIPNPESSAITVYLPYLGVITVTTPGFTNGESVIQGNSFNIVATLSGSNIPNQTISVNNLSSYGVIITSNPSPCTLQTATLSYTESCTFTVTPGWSQTIAGSYAVVLSNSTPFITPSQTTIPFNVYTPALYLQQTGQTPTSPIYESPGSDGYTYIGVPWAYESNGSTIPATRFVVTPDGSESCITDNLTGLMWAQNPSTAAGPDQVDNIFFWGQAIESIGGSHGLPVILCGYTDWRLSNINELLSLINYESSNPAAWLTGQGFAAVKTDHNYWTSSIDANNTGNAWAVTMSSGGYLGQSQGIVAGVSNYAWPVRGNSTTSGAPALVAQTGQTPTSPVDPAVAGSDGFSYMGVPWAFVTSGSITPVTRFTAAPDGSGNCITDNLTGLTWVTSPAATTYTWAKALITSATSGGALPTALCGYSDWRLPNINELKSLLNYGYTDNSGSNQATWLISQGFANIKTSSSYWSSTTNASVVSPAAAWSITMTDGNMSSRNKTSKSIVWPVRGGQ